MKEKKQLIPLSKPFFLFASAGFGFLFLLFTFLVKKKVFQQFDWDMSVKFKDNLAHHLNLTEYFCSLSFIGSFEIMVVILAVILIFKRKWIGAGISLALFIGAHVIELIGKTFLAHRQPDHFFLQCHNFIFPTNTLDPANSYPSGHSLRVVFIGITAIALIYFSKRIPIFLKLILILCIAGFMVAMLISRISLGEHWTTDVIGGTLLGAALSFFSLLFLL